MDVSMEVSNESQEKTGGKIQSLSPKKTDADWKLELKGLCPNWNDGCWPPVFYL